MLSDSSYATSGRLLELLLSKEYVVLQHTTASRAIHLPLLFILLHLCTATVRTLARHHSTIYDLYTATTTQSHSRTKTVT